MDHRVVLAALPDRESRAVVWLVGSLAAIRAFLPTLSCLASEVLTPSFGPNYV